MGCTISIFCVLYGISCLWWYKQYTLKKMFYLIHTLQWQSGLIANVKLHFLDNATYIFSYSLGESVQRITGSSGVESSRRSQSWVVISTSCISLVTVLLLLQSHHLWPLLSRPVMVAPLKPQPHPPNAIAPTPAFSPQPAPLKSTLNSCTEHSNQGTSMTCKDTASTLWKESKGTIQLHVKN